MIQIHVMRDITNESFRPSLQHFGRARAQASADPGASPENGVEASTIHHPNSHLQPANAVVNLTKEH